MRTVAALAIVVSLLAMPGWAQRGGSRGGFSGHSGSIGHTASAGHMGSRSYSAPVGPMVRGGFSGSGPIRFGAPRVSPGRPPYQAIPSGRQPYGRNQGGRGGDRDHPRRPYYSGYGAGLGYGYLAWPGYPFLFNDPGFYGYGDSDYSGYDAPYLGQAGPVAPNEAYDDAPPPYPGYAGPQAPYSYGYAPPPDVEQQSARPSYTGSADGAYVPAPEEALTVIFNDGRPPEQIHNYLITATTLTVLDKKYRVIPLEQINVAATEQTNRADGIDFRVPGGSR